MRIERDSMGEMQVPDSSLYGASTQRAFLNFEISDLRFPESFIAALGLIKLAAAHSNVKLGLLAEDKAKVIFQAAEEVRQGKLKSQFVLDIFQTGSGTSTNMNANEVIANRATQIMGRELGDKDCIHPNDHVNMSQSSNDVIPSAMQIALYQVLMSKLKPALEFLESALAKKAAEFSQIIKSGRTHLQDATPITLGQEFGGYAAQIKNGTERILASMPRLLELPLGGTAVGTGLNTHPKFAALTIEKINEIIGSNFRETRNHFEAQGSRDCIVEMSGQLKTISVSLLKIANDIRWLAAGPRCSLAEIYLPEIQPGSSIMPAKVNPVICESVMMVATKVMGNDTCISLAGQHGNFELNAMMPVMAYSALQSAELLAAVSKNFVVKCIEGIKANQERCKQYAEASLATCTSLAPIIGYDKAAALAKTAYKENKTIREVALEQGVLSKEQLDKALDLFAMTKPGV